MKLYFPDNIFTHLLSANLPAAVKNNIVFSPSSLIPGEIKKDHNSAGLITPTDLLTLPEILISSRLGISFEGAVSNSYIYFNPGQKDFNSIYLHGDITSLEVIVSKIFFRESYNSDVKVEILTDLKKSEGKNILVAGDENYTKLDFNNGLSFAEEMVDLLSLPYVNFIFASYNRKMITDMHNLSAGISDKIYDLIEQEKFGTGLPRTAMDFIKDNAPSLIYEFEDQDIDDVHQLIRLPYFYGLISDIIEPKFV